MTLLAGRMYRASDVAFDTANQSVYVVEQFNHRISKWVYLPTAPSPENFTFNIDAGRITAITVNVGGTGYSVNNPVIIDAPTNPLVAGVTATAVVATEAAGVILTVRVTNQGSGYEVASPPSVNAPTSGNLATFNAVVPTAIWGPNGDGTTGQGAPIIGLTDNSLYRPTGIVFDGSALIVTDTFHNRIRSIDTTTGLFLGSAGSAGFGDTNFYHPAGIAINTGTGIFVVADELNHRAVKYTAADNPTFNQVLNDPTAGSVGLGFVRPHGVVFDTITNFFNVTDSARGLVSRYNLDPIGNSVGQFGAPGSTGHVPLSLGTELFFPSSGHGTLTNQRTILTTDTLVQGSGYTDGEFITLSGGTGSGATANADIVGGIIQSVTIVGGGGAYTANDTLTITGVTSDAINASVDVLAVANGTTFADTRNNILKTLNTQQFANTAGTTAGTSNGQLYYPESVSSFSDTADYVLAANTLNNRVEVFTNDGAVLTFRANFGSPTVVPP